jgi:hypothetical protein
MVRLEHPAKDVAGSTPGNLTLRITALTSFPAVSNAYSNPTDGCHTAEEEAG